MNSILSEIKKIRQENELVLDLKNTNRHRVVVCNDDGTKSAYCFSAPIYNEKTLKAVDLKFNKSGNKITAMGSNMQMDITDKLQIKNRDGVCDILFNTPLFYNNEKSLLCGKNDTVYLTTNGIVYIADINEKNELKFEIETSKEYVNILENSGCFSLMKEKYIPYLIISCMGCLNEHEKVIAPSEIKCTRINKKRWSIRIKPCVADCNYLKFEINLYEQKIFQDTTVESFHPSKRNAFGNVAYIGNTDWFGKQWLYIRPELTRSIDLINKRTNYVLLRLPRLNDVKMPINAYRTMKRFCSFGSRWEKKVPASEYICDLLYEKDYVKLDITNLVLSEEKNKISMIDGIIIRADTADMNFVALATGDNYNTPPILEINYKL